MIVLWKNKLTELLQIKYPIIQAPMAGGPTTTMLVAAVSNAGGLGMIGAGYSDAMSLRNQIKEIRKATDKPFGVNLFIPNPYTFEKEKINNANIILEAIREELSASTWISMPNYEDDLAVFNEQVQIVIEENVPVCSFTFGVPSEELTVKLKRHSVFLMGTATTVKEAIINEQAGMDAVVVQGTEAGGHRGTFRMESQNSLIGLMSLIPQAADQIKIPIIAAGGIMDGRGIMAAKVLGAQAVQLGTAFLVCEESGAASVHKNAIVQSTEDHVVLTKSFSGKTARGLHNQFIEKMKDLEEGLPDFPLQNELTKGIRKAAAMKENPEFMSLWSGQSPRLAKKQTVQELMKNLIQHTEKIQKS